MTTLRDRLRVDTARLHDSVDAAYSALDLRQARPLAIFLSAHLSVLLAIRIEPSLHAEAAGLLRRRMVDALEADLHGLEAASPAPIPFSALDATAVLYILLGSSLGTQVLRRRWRDTHDPNARAAGRYLELAVPPGAWRALCGDLAQRSSDGAEADRIVADAGHIFDLHLQALSAHSPVFQEELHHG